MQPISDKNEIKDRQTCQMQPISDKNGIKDPQMQPISDLNEINDPQMQPISEEENNYHKRKERTNAFKLSLVACAQNIGNRATGKEYGVAE